MSKSKTPSEDRPDPVSGFDPAAGPDETSPVSPMGAAPFGNIVTPPAPPPASDAALGAEPQNVAPWLTTASSEGFGPAGHILNLTPSEAAAAPEGLLITPTPEQLAQGL